MAGSDAINLAVDAGDEHPVDAGMGIKVWASHCCAPVEATGPVRIFETSGCVW